MERIDWLLKVMQQGYVHKVIDAGSAIKVYRNIDDMQYDYLGNKHIAKIKLWRLPNLLWSTR